jgi:hypothetical protein
MATSTVEVPGPEGLTLSCQLFAIGSDTVVATVALTERTNNKGCYRGSLVDVPSGLYGLRLKDADNATIGQFVLRHTNAVVSERAGEHAPDVDLVRRILEADRYIDTTTTPWQLVLVEQGTGALGVGRELLRQNLKDEDGEDVEDITTFLGQMVSP